MDSTIKSPNPPKAKLPRKRKKAAIKAQGRKWYHDTIKLFYATYGTKFGEAKCKFWVNSSIRPVAKMLPNGQPFLVQEASRFW